MQTRELVIANRHGKRMPATLYEPEGAVRGFAIALHGLGGWRTQSVVVAAAEAVVREGYRTLTFDAADGAFAPDTDFERSTTTGFLEDLEDVVAFARNENLYEEPFVLLGHSLGGMIVSRYITRNPGTVSRAVLLAPAISWKLYTKWFLPYGVWWFITDAHRTPGPGGIRLPLRRTWLLDFLRYDIRADVPALTLPILVMVGEHDGVVARAPDMQRYAASLPQGTCTVVAGAHHTFKGYEAKVTDTIQQWLTSS